MYPAMSPVFPATPGSWRTAATPWEPSPLWTNFCGRSILNWWQTFHAECATSMRLFSLLCLAVLSFAAPAHAMGLSDWAAIVVAGDWHSHSGAPSQVFDN